MNLNLPTWFQVGVLIVTGVIAMSIAWGQVQTQISNDHELIVKMDHKINDTNDDIIEMNKTVHNIEKLIIEQNGEFKLLKHRVDMLEEFE